MKKLSLLFIMALAIAVPTYAQQIQWAYKVLQYSTQTDSREFAAVQVLGKPNALPYKGENVHAWEPKSSEKESSVKVGFLTPIIPKQIIIGESLNPGHISAVYVYDADGTEHKTGNPSAGYLSPDGLLHVNTSDITFNVLAVKIVLQHDGIAVGIDAIGITTSDKHFKIEVNENDLIKANMVATRMSDSVNSSYMEIGPLISPDGKTLYFSRRGDPADVGGKRDEEDIWYARWDASKKSWGQAVNMGIPINNAEPNFINSISPDGNTLLLGNSYLPDGTMSDGVSLSRRKPGGWTFPKRLIIKDEDANKSHMVSYFMDNSQKILMISNDRKGDSYGRNDLYVSFLQADSTWTKPLNLGKTINTSAIEDAPFLASDSKTLYFASDGFEGYGGTDIYMSRRLDDTWQNWSVPENLGPVVNSSHDESFFSLTASGKQVYFTSQVADTRDVDMYVIELPAHLSPLPVMLVHGRVFDSKTKQQLPGVHILFENLVTYKEIGIASSDYDSAAYQIVLPAGIKYGYLAQKDGYISISEYVDLSNMTAYKEYQKDLYLTPIEVGQVVVINNLFFEFNKFDLKKESFPELDRLAALLNKNSSMKIELSGYADSIGSKTYNNKLSAKRAEAVYNYLILKAGVDKNKLVLKHYGEENPAASNSTSKGRQLNRRVEFKILSK